MRIGVTGQYASGKGTVCAMFEKLGAVIIDTDIIARNITMPGSPCLDALIDAFGHEFLNPDGSLHRRALGKFVFSDSSKVKQLNAITHPYILQETLNLTSNNDAIYMINAPVLIESGLHAKMDFIIVIKADIELSIIRGQNRDSLTEDEILQRLKNQISLNEKLKFADYIIDNSGSLENTRKQVVTIWNNLKISSQKTQQ